MYPSDFYDTDSRPESAYIGTGDWDLMASGSWNNDGTTPAHHNPFTKVYVYNWATVITISSAGTISLNNAEENSNSFYQINTATDNEYFLIENRQNHKFDSYIPGKGMIIYHVDGSYINSHKGSNSINASSHQGFYPVCASATENPGLTISSYGKINDGGCTYPGLLGVTSFNDFTTPNSRSWAGASTNKSISHIAENTSNKTVSFDISIGTGVEASEISAINLSQNYPNPFDQSTTIDFSLIKPTKVSLTVYSTLGQVVDVIVDEYLTAGNHSKPWTPKGIAAGIYFYQLKADGIKETKRLVKK